MKDIKSVIGFSDRKNDFVVVALVEIRLSESDNNFRDFEFVVEYTHSAQYLPQIFEITKGSLQALELFGITSREALKEAPQAVLDEFERHAQEKVQAWKDAVNQRFQNLNGPEIIKELNKNKTVHAEFVIEETFCRSFITVAYGLEEEHNSAIILLEMESDGWSVFIDRKTKRMRRVDTIVRTIMEFVDQQARIKLNIKKRCTKFEEDKITLTTLFELSLDMTNLELRLESYTPANYNGLWNLVETTVKEFPRMVLRFRYLSNGNFNIEGIKKELTEDEFVKILALAV